MLLDSEVLEATSHEDFFLYRILLKRMNKSSTRRWIRLLVLAMTFLTPSLAAGAVAQNPDSAAACFPLWSLIPFLLMLVSIAVLPMAVPEWWDKNRNKTLLSVVMSLPVLTVVLPCDPQLLWHSLLD